MGRGGTRAGWALSTLVVVALLADAGVGLFAPQLTAADSAATGFTAAQNAPLAAIMIACAVLYAIPATAVLGAVLTTGFLGGAICAHFRIGEVGSPPQLICTALGVVAWGGLWLRDARVRALLPVRRRSTGI